MASGIELSTRVRIGGMQREDLVADEVVATCNALGNSVLDSSTGGLDSSRSPNIGGTLATLLLDLEPDSPTCCVSVEGVKGRDEELTLTRASSCCNQCQGTLPCRLS